MELAGCAICISHTILICVAHRSYIHHANQPRTQGGWVGGTGSNNYPLRGSKVSDFEGGVRAVAMLSGGYLPANVRGSRHTGYIHVADWYGTLSKLVGVDPADDVPGLPPVDSNNFWPSILIPNANSTGREVCTPPPSSSLSAPVSPPL